MSLIKPFAALAAALGLASSSTSGVAQSFSRLRSFAGALPRVHNKAAERQRWKKRRAVKAARRRNWSAKAQRRSAIMRRHLRFGCSMSEAVTDANVLV